MTFYFYFPQIGTYTHFPTNVSINRLVVAKAQTTTINVKKIQTKVDMEDFNDILATGSIPEILKFMRTKNLHDKESSFKF